MDINLESLYSNYANINESIPESFDQSYYDKTAREYHEMYQSYMPVNKSARILDIGCGKGFFLYYLKQRGYTNFLGVDADPASIDHTRKHITEQCELAFAEEFLSDKINLYHFVIMNEVLEHIPKEKIIPLLKTVRKSLCSNGILICYVPNMENPFTIYTRYHDFTHTIGFTQNSLKMVMKAAGFNNIEIVIPQSPKKGIKQFIKQIFRKIIKKLLTILFEYPSNGFIHVSRIFSVAKKADVIIF